MSKCDSNMQDGVIFMDSTSTFSQTEGSGKIRKKRFVLTEKNILQHQRGTLACMLLSVNGEKCYRNVRNKMTFEALCCSLWWLSPSSCLLFFWLINWEAPPSTLVALTLTKWIVAKKARQTAAVNSQTDLRESSARKQMHVWWKAREQSGAENWRSSTDRLKGKLHDVWKEHFLTTNNFCFNQVQESVRRRWGLINACAQQRQLHVSSKERSGQFGC